MPSNIIFHVTACLRLTISTLISCPQCVVPGLLTDHYSCHFLPTILNERVCPSWRGRKGSWSCFTISTLIATVKVCGPTPFTRSCICGTDAIWSKGATPPATTTAVQPTISSCPSCRYSSSEQMGHHYGVLKAFFLVCGTSQQSSHLPSSSLRSEMSR